MNINSLFLSFVLFVSFFSVSYSSLLHLCHQDESSSLLQFKNSFNSSSSFFSKSWKNGSDCCEWYGITCHPTSHRVIELHLHSIGLQGTLGPNNTLFLLRHLQSLDLSFNLFSNSSISPKFGKFSFLKHLDLSRSGFFGKVPDELGQLSQLQHLDLSWNYEIDEIPKTITNLSSLTYLDLRKCNLRGELPANILSLPFIQYVHLGGNEGVAYLNVPWSNISTSLEVLDLSSLNLSTNYFPSSLHLPTLRYLLLSDCNLHGTIPSWVWNISAEIDLSNNYFEGSLPLATNISLSRISFSYNMLTGDIPASLFSSKSLESIHLDHNHFTSVLSTLCHPNITNTNLAYIDLSYNNLRGSISIDFLSKLPNLIALSLSSSGISVNLPLNLTFSWPQYLQILELSDNNIHGQVPKWMLQLGEYSLFSLNLSHNSLTGSLDQFSGNKFGLIDISYNMLEGSIHPSICSLPFLRLLDLSNNKLSGELPHCLGKANYLVLLNLESNNIGGTLPPVFSNSSGLEYIGLRRNRLQGLIPQSLTRCTSLQVLDLKSNNLTDNFPYWLATLPNLEVLDLSSNNFHGPIINHSKPHSLFPKLQVLDLSNNNFSGTIPTSWIRNFRAMMIINRDNGGAQYMQGANSRYFFSIELTFNGENLKYEKIITSLVTFDLSNNAFEGEIPYSIGELVGIHGLNLSHNRLIGPIPSSIGKLSLLNCLDLSHNMLTGHIPQELVSLTGMGVFNVSENQLVGPIPHGFNFDTYGCDSYEGNPGLFGNPLSECGKDGKQTSETPTKREAKDEEEDEGIFVMAEWKIIMLGYASGTIVGLAWGYYMLSVRKPFWLVKCVHKLELVVLRFYDKPQRRARMPKRN